MTIVFFSRKILNIYFKSYSSFLIQWRIQLNNMTYLCAADYLQSHTKLSHGWLEEDNYKDDGNDELHHEPLNEDFQSNSRNVSFLETHPPKQ